MQLSLIETSAPAGVTPASELERLRADVVLASAVVSLGEPAQRARRRPSFGLDPRLRAADLRAMARHAAG